MLLLLGCCVLGVLWGMLLWRPRRRLWWLAAPVLALVLVTLAAMSWLHASMWRISQFCDGLTSGLPEAAVIDRVHDGWWLKLQRHPGMLEVKLGPCSCFAAIESQRRVIEAATAGCTP